MLVTAPIVLLASGLLATPSINKGSSAVAKATAQHAGSQASVAGDTTSLVKEKMPWLILSVGTVLVTFALQKRLAGSLPALPFIWRANNALMSYVIYVWQMFWPIRLAVFYPHPNNQLGNLAGCSRDCFSSGQPVRYSFCDKHLICPDWLVLVRGNASARDRSGSGRGTSARRPLYLPSSDRVISDRSLGCGRLRRRPRQIMAWYATAAATAIVLPWFAAHLFRPLIGKIARHFGRTLWPSPPDNDVAHNNLGYLCFDAESWTKRFRILNGAEHPGR